MSKGPIFANTKQAKDEFIFIVSKFLFPVFSITPKIEIADKKKRVNKLIELSKDEKNIIFYPSYNSKFSLVVAQTEAEIINQRIDVAEKILQELLLIGAVRLLKNYEISFITANRRRDRELYYRNTVNEAAIELGICAYLGGFPVYELLKKLEDWALKTYEGHKVSFCFLVNTRCEVFDSKVNFIRFLDSNHSAVFTDGITSCIELDKNGSVINFHTASKSDDEPRKPYAPYRFQDICRESVKDKIGIVLQSNGDILIFKNKELFCVRMNGKWKILNFDSIVHKIRSFLDKSSDALNSFENSKQVFLSVLDVSFSHTGGCLAIIHNDKAGEAEQLFKTDLFNQEIISEDDETEDQPVEVREHNKKIRVLQRLVNTDKSTCFFSLDRKLRQELMALDGATIIDEFGHILAIGAIVRVDGGSEGGGRLAAARSLSNYGFAIKVSMDGKISAYEKDKEKFIIF